MASAVPLYVDRFAPAQSFDGLAAIDRHLARLRA
jgi:hypothetical protein